MAFAHDVTLTWNASTSSGVTGYNVKRATVSGGPYTNLTPTPITNLNYVDASSAVQTEGSTFYYVVTALDPTGESDYSNEASAAIPFSQASNYAVIKGSVILKGSVTNVPITAQSGSCNGIQPYPCARTDFNVLTWPATPNMGGATGANLSFQDPEFGNARTVRVTDASYSTNNMMVSNGGGDWDNHFSKDNTKLLVMANGGQHHIVNFDPDPASPTYMQTSKRYPGWTFAGDAQWAWQNDNLLFYLSGTTVYKLDTTVAGTPPTPVAVVNFASDGNCLASNYAQTWNSFGGVGYNDDVFTAAFSNTGGQNTGVDLVAWSQAKGCIHVNMQTGAVTADLGWAGGAGLTCTTSCTGTITGDRISIHSVIANRDGNFLDVGIGTCIYPGPGLCNGMGSPYVWTVGTATFAPFCSARCGGHSVMGNTKWLNRSGTPAGSWQIRNIGDPAGYTNVNTPPPNFANGSISMHIAWKNVDVTDTTPFIVTHVYYWTGTTGSIAPQDQPQGPWWNEILGVDPVTGTVWRFGRMWTSGDSTFFTTQQGIGTVSRNGKFMAFTSDWHKTLGLTAGGKPRGDVFVMELK